MMVITLILWALVGFFINSVIGVIVGATVDDEEEERIFQWFVLAEKFGFSA